MTVTAAEVMRQSRLEQGLDPGRIDPAIEDQVAQVVARATATTAGTVTEAPAAVPSRKASAA